MQEAALVRSPVNSSSDISLNEWNVTLRKRIQSNGLFDTALLITNADQLRHALNVKEERMKITLITLISLSIIMQLICFTLLIWYSNTQVESLADLEALGRRPVRKICFCVKAFIMVLNIIFAITFVHYLH